MGWLFTTSWASPADDPRQVVYLDQHRVWLDDSQYRAGWNDGGVRAYQPPYRSLTKPLADLLAAVSPGEASVYAVKHRELNPHWHIPFADATLGGESNYHQPGRQLRNVPGPCLDRAG